MKSFSNMQPVVEALESRTLLSGAGADTAVLAVADTAWVAGTSPAIRTPQFSPSAGWADSWQHSGANLTALIRSGSTLVTTPVVTTPTPGSRVAVQSVKTGTSSQQLIIIGTSSADAITLNASGSTMTITTAQGAVTYTGVSSVTVYGFGGNDTIRLTYGMTMPVTVYCGDGADTVYDSGRGSDTVYGEAGNDTLISISGGSDRVYGGDGTDSFWVDGNDSVDATSAENAAGTVHRVYQFYGSVSMDINGQTLKDPALGRYATGYKNFASQPLFTDGPTYTDIKQGALGDCYFLASLAAIANTTPDAIRQMITPLGDGTYAVRFYRNGTPVYLRIDADLPVYSGSSLVYAKFSASGESWVPLLEKAYAFFRTGAGTYASIEGGWMADVCTQAVNRPCTSISTSATDQQIYTVISTNLAANHAVTAGSKSGISGPIVGNHAYMVKEISTVGGVMYVTVYNPWGYDGTNADSNSADGLIKLTMAQFKQYFTAAVSLL